jgi:hypothetical protein
MGIKIKTLLTRYRGQRLYFYTKAAGLMDGAWKPEV